MVSAYLKTHISGTEPAEKECLKSFTSYVSYHNINQPAAFTIFTATARESLVNPSIKQSVFWVVCKGAPFAQYQGQM